MNDLAKNIKLLVLDVDGICTDGKLYFSDDGEALKVFHVHDGLGIRLLQKANIEVAIITARKSEAVVNRMQALGVKRIFQEAENKQVIFNSLLSELNLTDNDAAYMGDDLPDLALIKRVKLGISVPSANEFVQSHADFITQKNGGQGAVREVCEMILAAQGKLTALQEAYL